MSDKGIKYDDGKIDFTLVPVGALKEISRVLMFGAEKYGRNNWQLVERERYHKALVRHVLEYVDGNVKDDESGLHHLAHAACCILFELYHYCEEDKSDEQS